MNQSDRIKLILKENGLKQKDFAAAIEVTESYVSKLIRNPDINISSPIIKLIEDKYGYNSEWIKNGVGAKYVNKIRNNNNLTLLQRRVISSLEKMSDAQVGAVMAFINALDDIEKSLNEMVAEELVPSRTINIYDLPVSAGSGMVAEEVDIGENEIEIVLDENSRRADYALRVKGNSMEPRFSDGDIILIRRTTPIVGDLGIVYLNGCEYFKQIGHNRLISLNPDYDDIIINPTDNMHGQATVIGKAELLNDKE